MRRVAHFLAAVGAALVSSAQAADKIVSMFVNEDTPYLTYMIEDCGECGIAQFTCGDGNGVNMLLLDFDDAAISKWLTKNGAHATLKAGGVEIDFTPQQISFSEMSGSWDVTFMAWGSDASAIEPLAHSKPATIETINGKIALPAREGDSANVRSFIDACMARP